MHPVYSLVIPTYGEKGLALLDNLIRIINYSCRLPHEVIIVDDGSSEAVAEGLEKLCSLSGAALLHDSKNGGFAKACNAGMLQAEGQCILICNNDVIPVGYTFDMLAEFTLFTRGVAGCKLLYPDRTIQFAGTHYVPPREGDPHGWFDHFLRFGDRHNIGATTIANRLITGALLGISGWILNGIGLFDEKFGMACEDVDYYLRVMELGAPVVYNGQIEAYHLEGQTRGAAPEDKAQHPEWTAAEEADLGYFFEKWVGVDWNSFIPNGGRG